MPPPTASVAASAPRLGTSAAAAEQRDVQQVGHEKRHQAGDEEAREHQEGVTRQRSGQCAARSHFSKENRPPGAWVLAAPLQKQ
jgi:hypothetical protein